MILKTLRLHNFRNYIDETFSFVSDINIIYGGNAQGKTSILEAIYLLSTGRSFRTAHLKDLIRHKEKYFLIEADIVKDSVLQKLIINFEESTKKITHNASILPSFTNLLGIMPSIISSPLDMDLIIGFPLIRRRFLNLHLAQEDPLYVHHLTRFLKALKQRNFLLKTQSLTNIELFESELAKSSAYLGLKRDKMISYLNQMITPILKELSDEKENLNLKYVPGFALSQDPKQTYDNYLNQLEKNRNKDLIFKNTLLGPHHDDFIFYLNNKNAKHFASEGQKRSIISALKLAEYQLLSERSQSPVLLSIDDLETSLDDRRVDILKSKLKTLNQVFITIPHKIEWKGANFLKINEGKREI